MIIRKFNENYSDGKQVLCIYDTGGVVDKTIIFDNEEQMNTYILNFVNNFISDYTLSELDFEGYKSIQDENGDYVITDPKEAYDWLNDWNQNSEPTLSICNYEEEKNVKLDNRIAIAISSKQYNL